MVADGENSYVIVGNAKRRQQLAIAPALNWKHERQMYTNFLAPNAVAWPGVAPIDQQ
jgi:hypothetical protein